MNPASMTVCVLLAVTASASGADRPSVELPTFSLVQVEDGKFVGVKGTWTIPGARAPGEQIADPLNSNDIWCDRSAHACYEAHAALQDGGFLFVSLSPYEVVSWNKQEIVAETKALCATSTLTINLVNEEVFRVTRNGGLTGGCKSSKIWQPLNKPVVEKLISGLDVLKAASH